MNTMISWSTPFVLGAFRVVLGFLVLCHGTVKLFGWPAGVGPALVVGEWPSWWAGVIEVLCGVALMAGVGTRAAAFLGSGTLAVAYFWQHQPDGLLPIQNSGETAALYGWALLLLVFAGPGHFALDSLRNRAKADMPGAEHRM